MLDREKFKQVWNTFYYIVYKAKRKCWQKFLEGKKRDLDPFKIWSQDKNRCWIALKYPKPQIITSNTLMLKESNNERAITVQVKKVLIRAYAFFNPLVSQGVEYWPYKRYAHLLVIKNIIQKALFCQSTKKVPEPNLHNFLILCLLWDWDADQITYLAIQALRLQSYPKNRGMQKKFL